MMSLHPPSSARRLRQRGLSLVELMVGITVGLFVVAGATLVVTGQLGDNRRLLLETQLQQDLRATSDIITRELRRAGAHGNPATLMWFQGASASRNEYSDVEVTEGSEVVFDYRRVDQDGEWGFKLDDGVIKTRIGDRWQDLTDRNTLHVAEFDIDRMDSGTQTIPCPRACSATDLTDTSCWPTVQVRSYLVTIRANSPSDDRIERVVRSQVRLRNNEIKFNDPDAPDQACPP